MHMRNKQISNISDSFFSQNENGVLQSLSTSKVIVAGFRKKQAKNYGTVSARRERDADPRHEDENSAKK